MFFKLLRNLRNLVAACPIIVVVLVAQVAFAQSENSFAPPLGMTSNEQRIAEACHDLALERFQDNLPDCNIDAQDVRVVAIDSRWYNPSKYVWYRNTKDCNEQSRDSFGHDTIMIQYYRGKCY